MRDSFPAFHNMEVIYNFSKLLLLLMLICIVLPEDFVKTCYYYTVDTKPLPVIYGLFMFAETSEKHAFACLVSFVITCSEYMHIVILLMTVYRALEFRKLSLSVTSINSNYS